MKKNTKKQNILGKMAAIGLLLMPSISFAQRFDYQLMESFPGFFSRGQIMTDLPGLITALYKFGIWTVGIAALFMLVIGGFMYMTSAGNTSRLGDAKNVIWDALLGLVAALGAFLLLYIINPDLTKINMQMTSVAITPTQTAQQGADIGCVNGVFCLKCENCVPVTDICKEAKCSLNSTLAARLRTAIAGKNARITEGWPPTVRHGSLCHQNGTCADVNLISNKGNPQEVKKIFNALKSAGLSVIYESNNCGPYTSIGVTCGYYSTMTYPSFHVKL